MTDTLFDSFSNKTNESDVGLYIYVHVYSMYNYQTQYPSFPKFLYYRLYNIYVYIYMYVYIYIYIYIKLCIFLI